MFTPPSRPRQVFTPKRPQRPQRPNTSTSQPSILPPIQLKAKDQEGEVELPAVEPLSEEEKAVQKSQRNDLLNLLSKNRKGGRGGGGRSSRPAPDTTQRSVKENTREVSPLENLFKIVTTKKVTSSSSVSSSSSESGLRVRPHGRKQSKRKGQARPPPSPTEEPELHSLSPQEWLVKKVQETLVGQERPRGVRKKVILRKEKTDRGVPRQGRRLGGPSQIKTRKIRVRRPKEEGPSFPIVY